MSDKSPSMVFQALHAEAFNVNNMVEVYTKIIIVMSKCTKSF